MVTPSSVVSTGQVVTVTTRISGYSGTEMDAYNFLVKYDKAVLAFVPGSFNTGTAAGPDQQWLSKPNQESSAQGYSLRNACDGGLAGEVVVSIFDTGFVDPETGTLAVSGFLVSFQLQAIAPGTTALMLLPFDDGSDRKSVV